MGKHPTGRCGIGVDMETVKHIRIHCEKYRMSKEKLKQELRKYDSETLKLSKVFKRKINKLNFLRKRYYR